MRLAHAKKRDANEKEIVERLRALNISVIQTDQVDLIVGFRGKNYLFEVKDPAKLFLKDGLTYRVGAITPYQSDLMSKWRGHYSIVWDCDMILEQIRYPIGDNGTR